jgi:hypothetical protein
MDMLISAEVCARTRRAAHVRLRYFCCFLDYELPDRQELAQLLATLGCVRFLEALLNRFPTCAPNPAHALSILAKHGLARSTGLSVMLLCRQQHAAALTCARTGSLADYILLTRHTPDALYAMDESWNNALHIAVRRGDAEFVKHVLTACPGLRSHRNTRGFTPLETLRRRHAGLLMLLPLQDASMRKLLRKFPASVLLSAVASNAAGPPPLLSPFMSRTRQRRLWRRPITPRSNPQLYEVDMQRAVRDILSIPALPVDVCWHIVSFVRPAWLRRDH